ncbi:MAG: hypothetical protein HY330_06715 [Chloroflexi bacterium]|nr:hypothetical protein [Chloroflexota bacterium]
MKWLNFHCALDGSALEVREVRPVSPSGRSDEVYYADAVCAHSPQHYWRVQALKGHRVIRGHHGPPKINFYQADSNGNRLS